MRKKMNSKTILKLSLILNALLLIVVIFGLFAQTLIGDKLSIAQLNAFQKYYCEDNYQQMLHKFNSETRGEMTYAMTVCLKNYKTGQLLDLKPLIDQVNQTDPKTDY